MAVATPAGDSMKRLRHTAAAKSQSGLTLIAVFVFLLLTSLAASALVQVHHTAKQREREEELLFIGEQYRQAIRSYYQIIPPGGARSLPRSLSDLEEDNRFPTPVRHIRRAYKDPMTEDGEWSTINSGAGISGVHSRSGDQPFRQNGFVGQQASFNDAGSYGEWIFAVKP